MRYRPRAREVEAWHRDGITPGPNWVRELFERWPEPGGLHYGRTTIMVASEDPRAEGDGFDLLYLGDWLVRDAEGRVSVCSPARFAEWYEPIPE